MPDTAEWLPLPDDLMTTLEVVAEYDYPSRWAFLARRRRIGGLSAYRSAPPPAPMYFRRGEVERWEAEHRAEYRPRTEQRSA